MLYIRCTNCGEILGEKVIIFENKMQELCKQYKIDYDNITAEDYANDKFTGEINTMLKKMCRRICCTVPMMTYCNLVDIVNK